jgi:hypothetical protein
MIGPTGSVGSIGLQGPIGSTGSTGLNGFIGVQGSTGSVGNVGVQGSTGVLNYGLQGSTGYIGNMGFQGSQGSQGSIGPNIGGTGPIGFNGDNTNKKIYSEMLSITLGTNQGYPPVVIDGTSYYLYDISSSSVVFTNGVAPSGFSSNVSSATENLDYSWLEGAPAGFLNVTAYSNGNVYLPVIVRVLSDYQYYIYFRKPSYSSSTFNVLVTIYYNQ